MSNKIALILLNKQFMLIKLQTTRFRTPVPTDPIKQYVQQPLVKKETSA